MCVLKYNYYEKNLEVTQAHMTHNHPTTEETYRQERPQKMLTAVEKKMVQVCWIYCLGLYLNVSILIQFLFLTAMLSFFVEYCGKK